MQELTEGQAPLAFIVHTPCSRNPYDLDRARENLVAIEEAATRLGFESYVEPAERLLLDQDTIPEVEQRLRKHNLDILLKGKFSAIHISGETTSEYVRAIVQAAYQTGTDVYLVTFPGSILDKYATWHRNKWLDL